jgi:hypothetical protein
MSKNIENRTKKLEDYLHLYLGCDVQADGNHVGKLLGYSARGFKEDDVMVFYTVQMSDDEEDWTVFNDDISMDRIKPILRPLRDMTEIEAEQCWKTIGRLKDEEIKGDQVIHYYRNADFFESSEFLFMLSKHFDLFGLIEAGIAIDKTKVNAEVKS